MLCQCIVKCILLALPMTQAAVTVIFDEDIRECDNGLPLPAFDVSQFEIIPEEDGTFTVNGSIGFTNDYGNPTGWKFYTTRMERGQWVTGIATRQMVNFCTLMQVPTEVWYTFTSRLEQKTCPYKKGHVEHMNMMNFGNMADLLQLPAEFVGEWRLYHEIATTRNGFLVPVRECFMIPATLYEL